MQGVDYQVLIDSLSRSALIIKSPTRHYLRVIAMVKHTASRSDRIRETKMKKTILTVFAATLMVASTAQFASAAERHHVRKAVQAPVSAQVRNANNFVAPVQPAYSYSDYSDGHAISAPAGR
jgi:hypothetical protein